MSFTIHTHLLRGETRQADELAEAALALSIKHGFTFRTAMIVFLQGWSLCQQGREAEGIARMRTGFADALSTGAKIIRASFGARLGHGVN